MKVKKSIALIMLIVMVLSIIMYSIPYIAKSSSNNIGIKKPVKLSIIDVAGSTQLVGDAISAFKKKYNKYILDIEIVKAPAPELVSKIKAQQMARNLQTTMVLTGYDGLGSGMESGIWEQLLPQYKNKFLQIEKKYNEGALQALNVAKGYGLPVAFCPGGPMLTYNPQKVKEVLDTPEKLLEWAKKHPGKFIYARPSNSGPGRAFLQGLPYLLGDKNPKEPKTWTKTWKYLKELDKYIDYYPTGTAITFKELAEGTRWVVASHLGWDMNQRILGVIPSSFKGSFFKNMTWITDTHFMCMPKGLDNDRKNATLLLMQWLLQPEQQVLTYDSGYFYPGPAIKNVSLSLAPAEIQKRIKEAMRDEYEKAIQQYPKTPQLDPQKLVEAFDMWDRLIGAKVKQ